MKGLALLAILLNHLVEEFGPGPWFTNPTNSWPDLSTRLRTFLPDDPSPIVGAVRFLGWLGDAAPGVFILVSGVGLTLSALSRPEGISSASSFYWRRAARLFPLYIAVHFVILGLAMLVPGNELTFANPKTLLSLFGLRATAGLFFYISPSWWFVWLMLQLYLVFPFLFAMLRRLGTIRFLALAVVATIVSRGAGLLWSDSLYYWMTGLFAGTRLAEFAAGMVVAALVVGDGAVGRRTALLRATAPRALLVYLAGLGASLFLPGTLVSNLLVTLGMTGLFFSLWRGVLSRSGPLAHGARWLGGASFGVFLLHQPPLEWTGTFFPGNSPAHLAAALAILALCVPLAVLLERQVARLHGTVELPATHGLDRAAAIVAIGALALLAVLEPMAGSERWHQLIAWFLAAGIAVLAASEWRGRLAGERGAAMLRRGACIGAALALFALPPGHGDLAALIGLIVAFLHVPAGALARGRWVRRVLALGAASGLVLGAELLLRRWKPLETDVWGELPALELHPTRVYGLKPSRTTRLRYNDYDYIVHANSVGLPGPEVSPARADPGLFRVLALGDAFTMPEGLEQERAYPARLQELLTRCLEPRGAEVINAGVTGYGPVEEAAQLRELAPLYQPDVVTYEFFVNDFLEVNTTPEQRRRAIGLTDQGGSRRAKLMARSQVVRHFQRVRERVIALLSSQPSPAQRGLALLQYYRTGENPLYADSTLRKLSERLAEMDSLARGVGAPLVVYYVPGAIAVDPLSLAYTPRGLDVTDTLRFDLARPLATLRGLAEPLGIPVVDLTSALRAHPSQPVYFRTAWHWTAEGHRAAASAMARSLTELQALPPACAPPSRVGPSSTSTPSTETPLRERPARD